MSVELETTESLYPFVLTEEQEQLRREIREFAAREIAPNVMKWDEASEFPLDVVKKLGQMGLLGVIFPPEYERGGPGLCGLCARNRRTRRRRWVDRDHRGRAQLALYEPYLPCRQRCAAKEVRVQTGDWRMDWRVGAHRARVQVQMPAARAQLR